MNRYSFGKRQSRKSGCGHGRPHADISSLAFHHGDRAEWRDSF